MQRRGIKTIEQFYANADAIEEDDDDENIPDVWVEYEDMMSKIPTDTYEDETLFMVQAYEHLVEELEGGLRLDLQRYIDNADSPQQAQRYRALGERGWDSNMTRIVPMEMDYLVQNLARVLVLSVLLLSALLPTLDALRRVHPLQYAARKGRGTFFRQALVTIAVGIMLASLTFWGIVLIYARTSGSWPFLWCDMSGSLFWADILWYDMTLWEYIAFEFAMAFILCLCAAFLGHLAGQFTGNFMHMLGALVPLGLGLNQIRAFVFDAPLSIVHPQPLIQPLAPIALLILCVVLLIIVWRWDKRREIMN
jgi:hypothetical protein